VDEFAPRWSPDGTEIVFYDDIRSGGQRASIQVMSANGGTPVRLTVSPGFNNYPSWSPDGLQIAFYSTRTALVANQGGTWLLSRDSLGGGWHEGTRLTDIGMAPGDWASDGSGVLCSSGPDLLLVSPGGRVVWRRNSGLVSLSLARFARDGRTIFAIGGHRDGRRGLWAVPASGGEARLVVRSDDPALAFPDNVPGLSVGPDRLYLTVAEYESDIWVAKLRY
jgi:Tol biopolymer transport system component